MVIERTRWTRPQLWSVVLVAVVSTSATAACTSRKPDETPQVAAPQAAGPEIDSAGQAAYGWHQAMAVGTRFTDGLNHLDLSGAATSPLTILSVTPLMDDGPVLRLVGTRIRVVPDMLPADSEDGWFQMAAGFPPSDPLAAGGVAPEGFQVRPANGDDDVSVEVQVGYEVVAAGISNRTGIEVIYEYQGIRKRAVIPSHLTICAPATVTCEPPE